MLKTGDKVIRPGDGKSDDFYGTIVEFWRIGDERMARVRAASGQCILTGEINLRLTPIDGATAADAPIPTPPPTPAKTP
jgi:hypothetical protein